MMNLLMYPTTVVLLLVVAQSAIPLPTPQVPALTSVQQLSSYDDELFAAIARAHGLPDLKEGSLSNDSREIRIRGHETMVCCIPTPMLRIVQGPDGTRGELLLFRRLLLKPGNPAPRPDEQCAPLRAQHICVRAWSTKAQDWTGVARALDELRAWSISEPCDLIRSEDGLVVGLSVIGDSGELHLQRRVGAAFSSYRCNAPTLRTTAAGQAAAAIYRYLFDLGGTIPYEPDVIAP